MIHGITNFLRRSLRGQNPSPHSSEQHVNTTACEHGILSKKDDGGFRCCLCDEDFNRVNMPAMIELEFRHVVGISFATAVGIGIGFYLTWLILHG